MRGRRGALQAGLALLGGCAAPAVAPPPAARAQGPWPARLDRLVAAYPDHLAGVEGDDLVWPDGTRMPTGAGPPARPFEAMLRDATIADQLRQPYAPGPLAAPPPRDHSPGRCATPPSSAGCTAIAATRARRCASRRVTWMPRTRPQPVSVTTVNDVAGGWRA